MTTNKPMLELIERAVALIDELNSIKPLLKKHIVEQRKQGGQYPGYHYEFENHKQVLKID